MTEPEPIPFCGERSGRRRRGSASSRPRRNDAARVRGIARASRSHSTWIAASPRSATRLLSELEPIAMSGERNHQG
jgi:hypothetical protein